MNRTLLKHASYITLIAFTLSACIISRKDDYSSIYEERVNKNRQVIRNLPRDHDHQYVAPQNYRQHYPQYIIIPRTSNTPQQNIIIIPSQPAHPPTQTIPIPPDNDTLYFPSPQHSQPKTPHSIMHDYLDWYDPNYSIPKDNDQNYIPPRGHGAETYPFYLEESG